jgi:hypothetical protein
VHGTGHADRNKGESLDDAFVKAWKDAKDNNGGQPGTYVVERIELDCANPINSYTVIIVSQ